MPARGPRYRTSRQVAQGQVRAHQALRVYLEGPGGLSYREVGERIGVSTGRAHALVKRALERIAEDTQSLARVWLARQLELHQLVMREAWNIASKPCLVCDGVGTVSPDNIDRARRWVGMNPDGTPAYAEADDDEERQAPVAGQACPRCRGAGFFYDVAVRLQAMDRHERACGHVAKLLGLYSPDRIDVNMRVSWREELAGMSDEDIDIMLLEYARDAQGALQRTGYVREAAAVIEAASQEVHGANGT